MLQYLPWFKQAGIHCEVQTLLSDEMLQDKYQAGSYGRGAMIHAYAARIWSLMQRRRFDLIWIEKEALPWLPATMERLLLRNVPFALDYDDALFHNYDLHSSKWVRRFLGRRIDHLMAGARLVTGGNEYLTNRAREAGTPWVEMVPTVVDLDRYALPRSSPGRVAGHPRIVWIGSPTTLKYVKGLHAALAALARQCRFTLRVIGGGKLEMPGVDVECVEWREETEVTSIVECDVGIMPLSDSPWERGKCGYKLIQYMACGLPVVASPIGVNKQIVKEGVNGFLVDEVEGWTAKLAQLLNDAALRDAMGKAGRQSVEDTYCVQQVAPRLANLLLSAAGTVL
jgi:glycosyltransferase involved in cell wall biosynthesis